MAEIRAFRATRFTGEAEERARSLAPPSEKISPEERERLAASPTNIVHATLPPSDPDDRSKFVRYARASAQLSQWRRGGTLVVDEEPALYRVTRGERVSLFALVALADLPPTEAVPVRARDERLRLLEATRTYLEPVPLTVGGHLWAEFRQIVGATLEPGLDAIRDPDAIAMLSKTLGQIAIGSAGAAIEAARAFRAGLGDRAGVVPEDYLLAELLPPGAEPSPSGLVLWSLGTFA